MTNIQITFIAANLAALTILVLYLYKQFEQKLNLEWETFETNEREY